MSNGHCSYKDPMIKRLLGDGTVSSPTSEDRNHAESCQVCREILGNIEALESGVKNHFKEIEKDLRRACPPPSLAQIQTRGGPPSLSPVNWFMWLFPAGVLCAGILLSFIPWKGPPKEVSRPPAQEIQSARLPMAVLLEGALMNSDGSSVTPGNSFPLTGETLKCLTVGKIQLPGGVELVCRQGVFRLPPDGIVLERGTIEVAVTKRKNSLTVTSPNALVTVRGTRFSVRYGPDGNTEVEVREGKVEVKALSGEIILIQAGEKAMVTKVGRIARPEPVQPPEEKRSKPFPSESSPPNSTPFSTEPGSGTSSMSNDINQ